MEKSHHKTKFMKLNTATWFASDLTENFVKMNPATLLNLHLIWRENSWNWILQLAFSSDLTANFVKMNFTLTLFWQKFRESNRFTIKKLFKNKRHYPNSWKSEHCWPAFGPKMDKKIGSFNRHSISYLLSKQKWTKELAIVISTYSNSLLTLSIVVDKKIGNVCHYSKKLANIVKWTKKIGKYPLHKIAITAKVHCWPRFARPTIR